MWIIVRNLRGRRLEVFMTIVTDDRKSVTDEPLSEPMIEVSSTWAAQWSGTLKIYITATWTYSKKGESLEVMESWGKSSISNKPLLELSQSEHHS